MPRRFGVVGAVGVLLSVVWLTGVRGADHVDGPAAAADPTSDIDDVYAWMSSDSADVNLVMTIGRNVPPDFRPSDQVQYVFHTSSRPSFGTPAGPEVNVICEFNRVLLIRCWAGNDAFVDGDAGNPNGIESADGRLKVFAGVRNDPFYFNLTGFNTVARTVGSAAPVLSFDGAGCPQLDAATSSALVSGLATGRDDFLGFEAFAIVVSLDKTLVTRNGPIISVWGSTHRKAS